MAHTFGGNNNVKGNLALMASEPAATLADPAHGNLQGWCICPEGTETNEVVYELMTDAGWQREPIALEAWIPQYCRARYGGCPPAMAQAWELLLRSAYARHAWHSHGAWQEEPSTDPKPHAVDSGPEFVRATRLCLSCSGALGGGQLYRNDLIELAVQAGGGYADRQLALAGAALQAGRPADTPMREALAAMRAMDALLHQRPDRRLETWVDAARAHGRAPDEQAYYDENARRLITTWGWPELSDYACRAWSGLTRDYYAARWEAWFEARKTRMEFSLDIWQQTWLSTPYKPSAPEPIPDLFAAADTLLKRAEAQA